MRDSRCGALVVGFLVCTAQAALGQAPAISPSADSALVEPPGWLYNDLACAPVMTNQAPPAIRILGSQDTVIKHMMGPGDTLVINAGTGSGLQPGQRFYVRRNVMGFGVMPPTKQNAVSVHTAGWIQIIGVDANISTATVLHACEGIMMDDYLEPFSAPMIAAHPAGGSTPQYANMGHIATGDMGIQNVGAGQLIGIDRGTSAGVTVGQRYLVFRDKRALRNEGADYSLSFTMSTKNVPLVEVGEIVVVTAREADATAQVVVAKDTVTTGDFIAEIR